MKHLQLCTMHKMSSLLITKVREVNVIVAQIRRNVERIVESQWATQKGVLPTTDFIKLNLDGAMASCAGVLYDSWLVFVLDFHQIQAFVLSSR